jgi:hypothetical protein
MVDFLPLRGQCSGGIAYKIVYGVTYDDVQRYAVKGLG